MKHREVAAMSKLKNFTSWKEVNKTINTWKTFPHDLSKTEQHDPTQPIRLYGDDETLKCRFQTSFYSQYSWIE